MIDKLREIISNWKYGLSYDYNYGGCSTCGWGSTKMYEVDDDEMEDLLNQINEFCESFKKEEK